MSRFRNAWNSICSSQASLLPAQRPLLQRRPWSQFPSKSCADVTRRAHPHSQRLDGRCTVRKQVHSHRYGGQQMQPSYSKRCSPLPQTSSQRQCCSSLMGCSTRNLQRARQTFRSRPRPRPSGRVGRGGDAFFPAWWKTGNALLLLKSNVFVHTCFHVRVLGNKYIFLAESQVRAGRVNASSTSRFHSKRRDSRTNSRFHASSSP